MVSGSATNFVTKHLFNPDARSIVFNSLQFMLKYKISTESILRTLGTLGTVWLPQYLYSTEERSKGRISERSSGNLLPLTSYLSPLIVCASSQIPENSWSFSAIRVQKQKSYGGEEYEEVFLSFCECLWHFFIHFFLAFFTFFLSEAFFYHIHIHFHHHPHPLLSPAALTLRYARPINYFSCPLKEGSACSA